MSFYLKINSHKKKGVCPCKKGIGQLFGVAIIEFSHKPGFKIFQKEESDFEKYHKRCRLWPKYVFFLSDQRI